MADVAMKGGMTHTKRVTQAITFETVTDGVAYWLALFGVYFTVGYLFWVSAVEKLFAGPIAMPAAVARPFLTTWVARFPGVNFLWGVLGVIELAVVLVLLASIVSGEFLPSRQKSLLQVSLALTLVTYSFLSFGQTLTGNFPGVLAQYTYFGMTILIMALVAAMPPNRPMRWLTTDFFRVNQDEKDMERHGQE